MNDCVAIILASGQSKRFGAQDKLLAPFRGRPLADYPAALAQSLPFKQVFAVSPTANHKLAELFTGRDATVVPNPCPDRGQGYSLALGMEAAIKTQATAAFVLLGDMPFVMPDDLEKILKALPKKGAAFAHNGVSRMPPALFHHSVFPEIAQSSGDTGARSFFNSIKTIADVSIAPERLNDIDDRKDLIRLA